MKNLAIRDSNTIILICKNKIEIKEREIRQLREKREKLVKQLFELENEADLAREKLLKNKKEFLKKTQEKSFAAKEILIFKEKQEKQKEKISKIIGQIKKKQAEIVETDKSIVKEKKELWNFHVKIEKMKTIKESFHSTSFI